MAPQSEKPSRMNSRGAISPRTPLSNERQQRQWRKIFATGGVGKVDSMNSEEIRGLPPKQHLKSEDDRRNLYQMYGGKYRKSAVRTDPSNGQLKSVLKCRNSGHENVNISNPYEHGYEMDYGFLRSRCGGCNARQEFDKEAERDYLAERRKYKYMYKRGHKENNAGWYKNDDDDYDDYDEVMNKITTKKSLVEEFRRVYRWVETVKSPKPSVRTDMLAWKEMEKRYGTDLFPIQTVGQVPGVEIGDEFSLRLELIIMGIHLQTVHGIDTMVTYPFETLLATSVVATEGYSDNMIDSEVLMYVGEGGNFEGGGGSNKSKNVKNQVMTKGNLGLKNSMKARTEVRVVRGIKRGRGKKSVFVYDGLYKVEDCFQTNGVFGNKQFVFKMVRCPGQKNIVWAKYKLDN